MLLQDHGSMTKNLFLCMCLGFFPLICPHTRVELVSLSVLHTAHWGINISALQFRYVICDDLLSKNRLFSHIP